MHVEVTTLKSTFFLHLTPGGFDFLKVLFNYIEIWLKTLLFVQNWQNFVSQHTECLKLLDT